MPTVSEVSWAKFRVAAMIVCAIGIVSVLIYLLLGGADSLRPAAGVRTYMVDVTGLKRKSPVRFNGIRVGEVTSVELSHLTDPLKVVRVEMSLMNRYLGAIPEDSTVALTADNILGDKFANINEGKSARHVEPGAILVTPPQPGINMGDLVKAAHEILANVDTAFTDIEAGRGQFGEFIKGEEFYNKLLSQVSAMQRQMDGVATKGSMANRLIYDESLYDQLHAPIKRLDDTLAKIEAGQGAAGKLLQDSAQYDQLRKSVGDLTRTLEELRAGKGQAGKLLRDDELYTAVARIVENLNAQVDALNASQLMASSSLYESLHGSTQSLAGMLKEFRANPKKFLWLKVF